MTESAKNHILHLLTFNMVSSSGSDFTSAL